MWPPALSTLEEPPNDSEFCCAARVCTSEAYPSVLP